MRSLLTVALGALALSCAIGAQQQQQQKHAPPPACVAAADAPTETRFFHLKNATQQNDANEVLVALRNILCPSIKVFLVSNQNAIVMEAPADQLAMSQKLIDELDHPHPIYRLTFSVTRTDAANRSEPARFSFNVQSGQHATLHRGPKVPVLTGILSSDATVPPPQVQYMNTGWTFDVTPGETARGVLLRAKVEESAASEKTGVNNDPVIQQAVLESVMQVALNKSTVIGLIETPGDGPRWEVAVLVETLP